MDGYEAERPGDGLFAFYYDNEAFDGEPKKVKFEEPIDLSLKNESPIDGINMNNFSIKWIGFIKIPMTGKYTFYSKADDGF